MEGKWTKGPWRAEYDNDTGPGDEGFWEFYAILDASGHGIGRFDDEKDAKLAAQAPAMAEALEELVDGLRKIKESCTNCGCVPCRGDCRRGEAAAIRLEGVEEDACALLARARALLTAIKGE